VKTIKIEIEETDRTDFLCVRCGGFRTEYAVRGSEHVGVHTRCLREARAQSAVRSEHTKTMVDAVKIDLDEEGGVRVSVEGPVERGPVAKPVRVRSRKDFEKVFGKVDDAVGAYLEAPIKIHPSRIVHHTLEDEEADLRRAIALSTD
jgi:hypothetical protein